MERLILRILAALGAIWVMPFGGMVMYSVLLPGEHSISPVVGTMIGLVHIGTGIWLLVYAIKGGEW